MNTGKYILDKNNNPILEPDLLKWGEWMEKANRRVSLDVIGKSKISTVFLGLDHAWSGSVPMLWETMVFGGELDQEQTRCGGGIDDAKAMHRKMVKKVKENE